MLKIYLILFIEDAVVTNFFYSCLWSISGPFIRLLIYWSSSKINRWLAMISIIKKNVSPSQKLGPNCIPFLLLSFSQRFFFLTSIEAVPAHRWAKINYNFFFHFLSLSHSLFCPFLWMKKVEKKKIFKKKSFLFFMSLFRTDWLTDESIFIVVLLIWCFCNDLNACAWNEETRRKQQNFSEVWLKVNK